MKRFVLYPIATLAAALAVLGGRAILAQDDGKSTVRIPDGFAMSDFKGFESWAVISVSQVDGLLKVILGNPAMIEAYQARHPRQWQALPRWRHDGKDSLEPEKAGELPGAADRARHPA